MRSVLHRRVHKYCDLPDAIKLDGRVWRFESLCFGSSRVGYATLGSLLLKTVDGGETWRYLGKVAPPGFGARKIFCLGAMRSWVACGSTTGTRAGPIPVLVTEDGGKHWDTVWAGDPDAKYSSKMGLFFVDERDGWLVVTQYTHHGPYAAVFGTTDSGAHWQSLGDRLNVRPQGVIFRNVNEGYLLAATPEQDRRRAFSVNLQNGPTNSEFRVGGNSSLLLSLAEGGGKSEPVMRTNSSLYAITSTASGTIAMCGAGGSIIRKGDSENTYERAKSGTRADLNDIRFSKQAGRIAGLAVGEEGVIVGSADEGKTWRRLHHTIGQCSFSAVAMLGASDAVVASSDAIYLLNIGESLIGRIEYSRRLAPGGKPQ